MPMGLSVTGQVTELEPPTTSVHAEDALEVLGHMTTLDWWFSA